MKLKDANFDEVTKLCLGSRYGHVLETVHSFLYSKKETVEVIPDENEYKNMASCSSSLHKCIRNNGYTDQIKCILRTFLDGSQHVYLIRLPKKE